MNENVTNVINIYSKNETFTLVHFRKTCLRSVVSKFWKKETILLIIVEIGIPCNNLNNLVILATLFAQMHFPSRLNRRQNNYFQSNNRVGVFTLGVY